MNRIPPVSRMTACHYPAQLKEKRMDMDKFLQYIKDGFDITFSSVYEDVYNVRVGTYFKAQRLTASCSMNQNEILAIGSVNAVEHAVDNCIEQLEWHKLEIEAQDWAKEDTNEEGI